jgi:hypothetical protein
MNKMIRSTLSYHALEIRIQNVETRPILSPAFGLREANLKNKEEISTKTAMQERF